MGFLTTGHARRSPGPESTVVTLDPSWLGTVALSLCPKPLGGVHVAMAHAGAKLPDKSDFYNSTLAPSHRGRRPLHFTCRSCRPTRRWTPCLQPGGPGVDAPSGLNTGNAPQKRNSLQRGIGTDEGVYRQASGSFLLVPQRLAAASRQRAGPRRSRGREGTLPTAGRSPAPRRPAPR
jgi:hypothetical protein